LALQESVLAAAGGNGDWHLQVRDIITLHFLGGGDDIRVFNITYTNIRFPKD
jgi:hypothetical protein